MKLTCLGFKIYTELCRIQFILIKELLKSLYNAHELLGKHVETNNKFVETDAMTQLELDELRTECERLREELNVQRANAEEREAHTKEVKKAQEEKVKIQIIKKT